MSLLPHGQDRGSTVMRAERLHLRHTRVKKKKKRHWFWWANERSRSEFIYSFTVWAFIDCLLHESPFINTWNISQSLKDYLLLFPVYETLIKGHIQIQLYKTFPNEHSWKVASFLWISVHLTVCTTHGVFSTPIVSDFQSDHECFENRHHFRYTLNLPQYLIQSKNSIML